MENDDAGLEACLLPKMSIFNFRGKGIRERENGDGGDYSRQANSLNMLVRGGQ